MKLLSKMVNFRTTPERYEQLKALAVQMPYPKTVAHLIIHGLMLAQAELVTKNKPSDDVAQENVKCSGKKSTRPARSRSKTPARPTKRKT
jgi:hypothetical protein